MRILSNVNILGTLDLDNVQNAAADTDRFLVQDANGVVKFRTGAEVASDIGASVGFVSTVKHEVKLGEAIAKGQAVYVTSSDGTNMIVSKASNGSDATSSKTFGLLETGGAANAKVFVITEGLLAGLDTSLAATGDPVWLGTAGNLLYGVANKPVAPAHMVFIGIVTRVNANNGEIFVKVQNGFELEELHNVLITAPPVDKAVIQYDTASGLWKNSALGGVTGTGVSGQVVFWNSANTQTGSNNLFWDATNNMLGIGTNTPATRLRINYSGTALARFGTTVYTDINQDGIDAYTSGAASTLYLNYYSQGAINFINNRMTLTTTGRLLLGSTSDNGLRFQVTGDGYFSGSVGVGTSSPARKLDVYGSAQFLDASGIATTIWSQATTGAGGIGTNNNYPFAFLTNGTEKMRLDALGNLGLGVSPNASWAVGKVLQINNGSFAATTAAAYFSSNWYYDGANKYLANGFSTTYQQFSGQHVWYNAPNNTSGAGAAMTLTQAMTLDASGNLGLGATSPISFGTGIASFTFKGTSASVPTRAGAIIFESQSGTGGTSAIYTDAGNMRFYTGATNYASGVEQMRLTSGGNLLIGTTTDSGERLVVSGTGLFTGQVNIANSSALRLTRFATQSTYYGDVAYTYAGLILTSVEGYIKIGKGTASSPTTYLSIVDGGAATFSSSVTATGFIKTGGLSTEILRADGQVYLFPLAISSPSAGQVLKYNGTSWVNDSDAGITGSGTTNYLPKFTGATTLGNSIVYDTGSAIGIGTASPSGGLEVSIFGSYTYFSSNANGAYPANVQGISFGWNSSGGMGETIIAYNKGAGSTGGLIFANNDGGSYAQRARLTSGGNFIINNASTDNGLRFQVTGDGSFSGNLIIGGSTALLTNSGRGNVTINGTTDSILTLGISNAYSAYFASASNRLEIDAQGNRFIQFNTNGLSRATLDASGNLGLGVTPSAWDAGIKAFEIFSFGNGIVSSTPSQNILSTNAKYVGGGWKYGSNGLASTYQQQSGVHTWNIAPSGSANAAITFTQAMTLDASGNLGLGTASPSAMLTLRGTTPFIRIERSGVNTWQIQNNNVVGTITGFSINNITSGNTPFLINAATDNLIIGGTADTGEKLQVTGTMRVSGASTFAANVWNTSGGNNRFYFDSSTTYFGSPNFWNFQNNSGSNVVSINSAGAATFSSSVTASGTMQLGEDGTYGSTYKMLAFTGNTNGSHRIFAGTADDLYIAAASGRGIRFWTAGSSANILTLASTGAATFSSSVTATRALIGTTTFNTSAVLQADSTTQGFLPPRMTAAQRAAISTPAIGLVVYQTDGTEGLYIYTNANGWKSLAIVN